LLRRKKNSGSKNKPERKMSNGIELPKAVGEFAVEEVERLRARLAKYEDTEGRPVIRAGEIEAEKGEFEAAFPGYKAMLRDNKASTSSGYHVEQPSNMFKVWLHLRDLNSTPVSAGKPRADSLSDFTRFIDAHGIPAHSRAKMAVMARKAERLGILPGLVWFWDKVVFHVNAEDELKDTLQYLGDTIKNIRNEYSGSRRRTGVSDYLEVSAPSHGEQVQWWLAELDQYGNPTLTDGMHSDRAGANRAFYLHGAFGFTKGERYAVAKVELFEPVADGSGVNHEAVETVQAAMLAAAPSAVSQGGDV
jgi:hypothetical protein